MCERQGHSHFPRVVRAIGLGGLRGTRGQGPRCVLGLHVCSAHGHQLAACKPRMLTGNPSGQEPASHGEHARPAHDSAPDSAARVPVLPSPVTQLKASFLHKLPAEPWSKHPAPGASPVASARNWGCLCPGPRDASSSNSRSPVSRGLSL